MKQQIFEECETETSDDGEVPFKHVSAQWRLVRIIHETALRKIGSLANSILAETDNRAKISDPNYLFLSLRDAENVDAILLVVRLADKRIETFCLSEGDDTFASVQAIAPLIHEYGWSKRYLWEDGFVIDADGDAFNVNALPSVLLINGDLDIAHQAEVRLPEYLLLRGDLTLNTSSLKAVPHYLYAYNVTVTGCTLPMIAERLRTEGDVCLSSSNIDDLATAALVRGNLQLSKNPRHLQLPRAMSVGGDFSATSDTALSFGDDTMVLGKLNVGPSLDGTEFGQDLIGRVIKTGDLVKIASSPEIMFCGEKMTLTGAGADGTYLGRHRDGRYACSVSASDDNAETVVSPRREELLAVADMRITNATTVAANQKARWVLH
jgi:hypothetical protein